ncbi:MAG: serine hydrolase [Frankiales bacterium]|nr:serine hydrolase [Frankiales bacterium]
MALDPAHWQERVDALADKHGVVGATLALAQAGETVAVATGVLNVRTGQPATPDSLFQAGSITKVWTATLVMQLVDDGLLDLDAPVVTYLPGFRVQDERLTATVTTRQLLSHTSGIDGDLFLDTGRGDDALPKYVEAMADLTETVPQGQLMSYCNSGYSLLGHLVATLRDATFEQVLRERLLQPLGLTSAGMLPEEALLFGAATGHLVPPGADGPIVTPQWGIFRSAGPAGLLHCTATDLLALGRLHLDGGLAPDGTRLLSQESVDAMLVPQVECPNPWQLGNHWGLGWILSSWGAHQVFGHDGATLGQGAFYRVLPGADLHIAMMVNGGRAAAAFAIAVLTEIGEELVGAGPLPYPEPSDGVVLDPARYVGSYSREGVEHLVEQTDGGLQVTITNTGPLAGAQPPTVAALVAHDERVLLVKLPNVDLLVPAVFFDHDGGRYLHFGARATRRS